MTSEYHKQRFFDFEMSVRLRSTLTKAGYNRATTVADMAALLANKLQIRRTPGLGAKAVKELTELVYDTPERLAGHVLTDAQANIAKIAELEEQVSVLRVELRCAEQAKAERDSQVKSLLRVVGPLLFHAVRLPLAAVLRWRGDDFLAALKEADKEVRDTRRSLRK